MADSTPDGQAPEQARGFPFFTAAVTLAILFVFVGLTVIAYQSPNYLDEKKDAAEPKADPATRLAEIRAKNQAVLDGNGAKMSAATATAELLDRAKKDGKLPFPVEMPAQPTADPKKTK
jgi:hypothetical protein